MPYLRVNLSTTIIMSTYNPEDTVLNLHNLIIRNGGISFISTNLSSILASLRNRSISYFTSRSGKAVLSVGLDCTSLSECRSALNEFIGMVDELIKTLSPKSLSTTEYSVRYELRVPVSGIANYSTIDELLRNRGFLMLSREVKSVDMGYAISEVVTYTYKYITEKLNIILLTVVYTPERNWLGIRIVSNIRTSHYSGLKAKELIEELIMVNDTVMAVISEVVGINHGFRI